MELNICIEYTPENPSAASKSKLKSVDLQCFLAAISLEDIEVDYSIFSIKENLELLNFILLI